MYSMVLCESNTKFYQTSSNNLLAVFPQGLQLPHQENLMQSTPKNLVEHTRRMNVSFHKGSGDKEDWEMGQSGSRYYHDLLLANKC
jgi:hypothetical protein